LKVEWCKAYARVQRWREEMLILEEEMWAVVQGLEDDYAGGVSAYAFRQADVWRQLKQSFELVWARNTGGRVSSNEQPNFIYEYYDDQDRAETNVIPTNVDDDSDEEWEDSNEIFVLEEVDVLEEVLENGDSQEAEEVEMEEDTHDPDIVYDDSDLDLEELALSASAEDREFELEKEKECLLEETFRDERDAPDQTLVRHRLPTMEPEH
ncbi:hypothetical protein F5880DRAFT_1511112, partial [Lentinula raphanica]